MSNKDRLFNLNKTRLFGETPETEKLKMSSKEIAELTGKKHFHVLRDIDNLNRNYLEMSEPKIGYVENQGLGAVKQREAFLTKMQCLDLLTGYDTKLRIKVNRRWAELEKQNQTPQIPQSFAEALQLAANQAKEIESQQTKILEQKKQIQAAEEKLQLIEPLIKILKSIKGVIDIQTFARETYKVFKIGPNNMFDFLRKNKIIRYHYTGTKKENFPYQIYLDQGWFEIITKEGQDKNNEFRISHKIMITAKGRVKLCQKIQSLLNKENQLQLNFN